MNMNMNMNNNMLNNPFLNNNYNMNMNMMNMNLMNMNMNMMNNQNFINPNNINQNMNLNQINQNLENNNSVEDVLPYINEPKKILKFSTISNNSNGNYITVKLPNSITRSDLYSIAKKYQTDYFSDIILSYNNYLLKNDNSTIEGIPENSIINIIEDVDYPDDSYYNNLMKKNEKEEKIQFGFEFPSGKRKYLRFPNNITFSEMEKAAFSKLSLNTKSTRILNLPKDKNEKLNTLINNFCFPINTTIPLNSHWKFGKIINAKIKDINEKELSVFQIGTLNSTLQLYKNAETLCSRKVKKLSIKNKLIERENIKSLASIGINEDFECIVELGEYIYF